MGQPKPHNPRDRIEVDPNAEKKLAEILKRALSTRSSRHGNETNRAKPPKGQVEPTSSTTVKCAQR